MKLEQQDFKNSETLFNFSGYNSSNCLNIFPFYTIYFISIIFKLFLNFIFKYVNLILYLKIKKIIYIV